MCGLQTQCICKVSIFQTSLVYVSFVTQLVHASVRQTWKIVLLVISALHTVFHFYSGTEGKDITDRWLTQRKRPVDPLPEANVRIGLNLLDHYKDCMFFSVRSLRSSMGVVDPYVA